MKSKEQLVNRSGVKLSERRCAADAFREVCNISSEVPEVMRNQRDRGGREAVGGGR